MAGAPDLIEKFDQGDVERQDVHVWVKARSGPAQGPGVQVDEEPWMLFKDARNKKGGRVSILLSGR